MYSAIIQIQLTQDVILNLLKFEQHSFDQGFRFKFVWIFRYSILSDQLALVSNVCSDLLMACLFNCRHNQLIWYAMNLNLNQTMSIENSVMRFGNSKIRWFKLFFFVMNRSASYGIELKVRVG